MAVEVQILGVPHRAKWAPSLAGSAKASRQRVLHQSRHKVAVGPDEPTTMEIEAGPLYVAGHHELSVSIEGAPIKAPAIFVAPGEPLTTKSRLVVPEHSGDEPTRTIAGTAASFVVELRDAYGNLAEHADGATSVRSEGLVLLGGVRICINGWGRRMGGRRRHLRDRYHSMHHHRLGHGGGIVSGASAALVL